MIKSRRMGWAGRVMFMGQVRNVFNFCWKPDGNRTLETPRRKLGENIEVDL
jgi:hypothetical protein